MDLKIGFVGNSHGWIQILNQIGIKFDILEEVSNNLLLQYPVVVLSEFTNENDVAKVKSYVETGGSLLCSTGIFYGKNTAKNLKDNYVKYLVPDNIGYFNIGDYIDLWRKIKYSDFAEHLKLNSSEYTLSDINYGDGKVILLPFDPGSLYEDTDSKDKSFYSFKNRLPHERVSKISKGPVRRLVNNALEYLFHSQNLLFCHKWYFPSDEKNIFLFRVDTDMGTPRNVIDIYKLASDHEVPVSWFIDVKSQKKNLDLYREMKNHELALHCFEHKRFKKMKEFRSDLKTAIEYFYKYGIYPEGYAVVYGKWNQEIALMIHDFNFAYSSEFGFDYDNLPSFDKYMNFQIPIHPICVGNLKRQGYSTTDMIRYFDMVIQKKISVQEPLVFYHHPNDENIEVIHFIFNKIKNLQIPSYSFINFAKWWKKRIKENYSAKLDGDTLSIQLQESSNYFLRLTNKNNQEVFIGNSGTYNLEQLNWKTKPTPVELPRDYRKIYRFNIWKIINKIEDMI